MSMALAPVGLGGNAALALRGPVGSLDAYIETVSRIPVLARDEEVRLAKQYRDEGDLEAAW